MAMTEAPSGLPESRAIIHSKSGRRLLDNLAVELDTYDVPASARAALVHVVESGISLVEGEFHETRFRPIARRYPLRVTESFRGDLLAAMASSDNEVGERVYEWEKNHGVGPKDWMTIGHNERANERADD